MADILAELEPLFRDVLGNPELHLARESSASNVKGWDSLAHINLISAIELEFGIRFALGEHEQMKNVGQMVDLMEQKLGAR
jgi:acyl carrier protein